MNAVTNTDHIYFVSVHHKRKNNLKKQLPVESYYYKDFFWLKKKKQMLNYLLTYFEILYSLGHLKKWKK